MVTLDSDFMDRKSKDFEGSITLDASPDIEFVEIEMVSAKSGLIPVERKKGSSGFTVGKKISNISYGRRFRQGNHRVSGVSEGYKSRPPKRMLPIAKSVGVFFAVWIFEFRPSLTALVMRCSKYVSNQRRLMGSSRWDDRGHSEFYYRHRSRSSARIGGWT